MSAELSTGIRVGDRERERVARVLRAAVGEGLLTLGEGDERLAAAYGARYRHELGRLTADLPDDGLPLIGAELRAEAWAAGRGRLLRRAAFVAVAGAFLVALWVAAGAPVFLPLLLVAFLALRLGRHAYWLRHGRVWHGYRRHWHRSYRGSAPQV